MSADLILKMENITKSFPGVKVFDGFDFDLRAGEVHGICGENGAGKSTLIKILSGAYQPDGGTIYFEGKEIHHLNPRRAMEIGIQTIYQEHNMFPLLRVAENLFVGNEETRGIALDLSQMARRSKEILEYLHASFSPHDILGELGTGAQKIVEIAKALLQESKVIILDEPTASLSQTEITTLLEVVRKLAKEGVSIIYISHHIEEVFQIADRITVIRDGIKVLTEDAKKLNEQKVVTAMVGRDVSKFYDRKDVPVGETVFEARNVSGNGVKHASLEVRRGEILGIAGMVGSGRTELAQLLFGAAKLESGEILINGKKVNMKTPGTAISKDMCYLTEDRQHTGLFLEHSLDRNIPIANYAKTRSLMAYPSKDKEISEHYVNALGITTPSVYQKAKNLSGGNQQKVVLAKWFATKADIFIFDEPTLGIDVGAKEEIYKLMVEILENNKAIIMISSDMPELIAMSNRVLVMRNGEAVTLIDDKEQISEEHVLAYSIGGTIN